jgi:hypothetical protein
VSSILNIEESQQDDFELRSSSLPFISPEYSLKNQFNSARNYQNKFPQSSRLPSRKKYKLKKKYQPQKDHKIANKDTELSAWHKKSNSMVLGAVHIDFEMEDQDITQYMKY